MRWSAAGCIGEPDRVDSDERSTTRSDPDSGGRRVETWGADLTTLQTTYNRSKGTGRSPPTMSGPPCDFLNSPGDGQHNVIAYENYRF